MTQQELTTTGEGEAAPALTLRLHTVRVNGHVVLSTADMAEACREADSQQTTRPDARVTLRTTTTEPITPAGVAADVERLVLANPEAALTLWHKLAGLIASAPFPTLVVESVTDDGETFMGARCPHCSGLLAEDGLTVRDWGTTDTESNEVNADQLNHSMSYNHKPHMETLHYLTTCCNRPVSLPTGWSEHN